MVVEKEIRRQQEEEEERKKPGYERKQLKKKRTPKRRTRDEAASASDAIEKILQEKKISSKINYDVLKGWTTSTKDFSQFSSTKYSQLCIVLQD